MFKCELIEEGYSYEMFRVTGTDGMTDSEIINACDPCNFGGVVYGRTVKVYID